MKLLNDPLLKPEQAAPYLGLSARETRNLCSRHLIRHEAETSIGGRTRYFIPESAIAEYKKMRTQPVRPLRRVR